MARRKKTNNKYDVILKLTKKDQKGLLKIMAKIYFVYRKEKKDKITNEQASNEYVKYLSRFVPLVKDLSHAGYESLKDLSNLSTEELANYINELGMNYEEFKQNYHENVNNFMKLILALAILDKNDIRISKINNPKKTLNNIAQGSYLYMFENSLDSLNDDDQERICSIFKKDFSYENITDDEKSLIEEYHNKFMQEYVNPYVKDEVKKEDLLYMVKTLGQNRNSI